MSNLLNFVNQSDPNLGAGKYRIEIITRIEQKIIVEVDALSTKEALDRATENADIDNPIESKIIDLRFGKIDKIN
jgi:hypothetical protein